MTRRIGTSIGLAPPPRGSSRAIEVGIRMLARLRLTQLLRHGEQAWNPFRLLSGECDGYGRRRRQNSLVVDSDIDLGAFGRKET